MTRALLTMGANDYDDVLRLSLPGMREFAARHGYRLEVVEPVDGLDAYWSKVHRIREALRRHELVLWLDADVLVLDPADDPADELTDAAWLAAASDRRVGLNLGVWLLRAGPDADRLLGEMLDRAHPGREGPEHEQGALRTLLGLRGTPPRPWLADSPLVVLPDRFGDTLGESAAPALRHVAAGQGDGDAAAKIVRMVDELAARRPDAATVLRCARALLGRPERWDRRDDPTFPDIAWARRGDGIPTWWGDPLAASWCISGALNLARATPARMAPVLPELDEYAERERFDALPGPRPGAGEAATRALERALGYDYLLTRAPHAHAELLAALDRAIDACCGP